MSLLSGGRKTKKRRTRARFSGASDKASQPQGELSHGPRRRAGKPHGKRKGGSASRRLKRWREAKLFLIVIAISLGAAFISTFLLKADMGAVANYFLFGSTDPYLSPERSKSIESEFKDEMRKLMK